MTHNNFASAKKYVSLGVGAALLSGYALSEEDEEHFDIFPLDRHFPKRKIGIIVRKRKYLSSAVKAFVRSIKPDIQLLN